MKWKFGAKATRDAKSPQDDSPNLQRGLGATRPVGVRPFTDSGPARVQELLCQTLESEIAGTRIYDAAIRCAVNPQLAREWGIYAAQARRHEEVLLGLFRAWGIDPDLSTAARTILRENADALAASIDRALATAAPDVAQLVAAECVMLMQTKANLNWDLLGKVSGNVSGTMGDALKDACDQVEGEESEQLYHTMRWANQLWLAFLGRPPVLPTGEASSAGQGSARSNIARPRSRRSRVDSHSRAPGGSTPDRMHR